MPTGNKLRPVQPYVPQLPLSAGDKCAFDKADGDKCKHGVWRKKTAYRGPFCYLHAQCRESVREKSRLRRCHNKELGGGGYCVVHSRIAKVPSRYNTTASKFLNGKITEKEFFEYIYPPHDE